MTIDLSDDKFLEDRILIIDGEMLANQCETYTKKMLYLMSNNNKDDVTIYINSCGGDYIVFLTLYSLLSQRQFTLHTVALGTCFSGGALLLLSGDDRSAYKYSDLLLHEVRTSIEELSLHGLNDRVKLNKGYQKDINEIIRKHTKIKNIPSFLRKDKNITSKRALELGIIDRIIG